MASRKSEQTGASDDEQQQRTHASGSNAAQSPPEVGSKGDGGSGRSSSDETEGPDTVSIVSGSSETGGPDSRPVSR